MDYEQPNLHYLDQIVEGDNIAKQQLIDVLKMEFPINQQNYYESLAAKDFTKIAENVHCLKSKISILGLEKSYTLVNVYEQNLKNNSLEGYQDFETILQIISLFLKTI
jgi:hypothetical protein